MIFFMMHCIKNGIEEHYLLTDGSVTSKNVCILEHGQVGWVVDRDLKNATPFGETATVLVVLRASLSQVI